MPAVKPDLCRANP